MIRHLVAILWISYLNLWDCLSLNDYGNCLQLRFVGKSYKVSNYSQNMDTTSVRISLANIPQDFEDRMTKEWKHSCVLAEMEGDPTSTLAAIDKILWFMQALKANDKALILSQEILGRIENTLYSIHRSYDIFVKDFAGKFKYFPILGIGGTKDEILQVGYLFIWPYVLQDENGQLSGTDIKALDLLARKYGFGYNLVKFNRLLHSTLPNGTSIGVFPDINNGVFDMGIGQLTITKDRRISVEFSINMFYREIGFGGSLARRVDAFNTLILPFDTSIWLALLVSIATYFTFLVVSEFVMGWHNQSDQVFISFWLTVSPLLNDSVPSRMHAQNRYTARWFSLTLWLLIGAMLSMAYKSNLLATLTIVKKENPVNSPEEILETDYPVYTLEGTVMSEGLQSSPMPIYRQIFQEAVLNKKSLLVFGDSWDSPNEDIRNGKAFKVTTKFDALADPTIRFLPNPFFTGSSGWFFMKGSVIEKQISADCQRLLEAGLLDHWERDYIEKKNLDNTAFYETLEPIHTAQPITVTHFLPTVVGCSIGFTLSLMSFFFEMLFGKNQSWFPASVKAMSK